MEKGEFRKNEVVVNKRELLEWFGFDPEKWEIEGVHSEGSGKYYHKFTFHIEEY